MNRSAWVGFLIGAALLTGLVLAAKAAGRRDGAAGSRGPVAWRSAFQLREEIGVDAYNDLAALQPRITAPVIRVAPPNPRFGV